jgi:hypothetical protein
MDRPLGRRWIRRHVRLLCIRAIHDEWRPEWLVIPLAIAILSTAMTMYFIGREVARLVSQDRKAAR